MDDLNGQVAIVTGGTRGIGGAITRILLLRGATVIAIYAANVEQAEKFGAELRDFSDRLQTRRCNVADEQSVQELFSFVEKNYKQLDILVNNAGVRRDAVAALMTSQQWQDVIDINLTGTFLMSKHAVLLMLQRKYGRIINITSPAAHLGFQGQTNYAASKAGQIGLTRSLAKEVARKKITVNCVSPGFIGTDFLQDLPAEQLAEYKKLVPMKRFGTPEEVAEVVCFLAGRGASYVSGSTIEVSGGL
jgi:3-oxoacyl-[acyl-carrier protein] reductase